MIIGGIPLAVEVIDKEALALNPRVELYSKKNITFLLFVSFVLCSYMNIDPHIILAFGKYLVDY